MEHNSSVYLMPLDNATLNFTMPTECITNVEIVDAVKALMYIMYIAISIAAIGGNGIVCYIIMAYQRMRTVTNFFIMNLAIGDILVAVLCIPFTFVANLLLGYWPFGYIMCVVVTYSQCVTVFTSAYTLIAISIDRYIAILYPLKPRMSRLKAKLIILLVWLFALLTTLPTALKSDLHPHPACNNTVEQKMVCQEMWEHSEYVYYYSMALMILQYFFPLVVLIFTYTRIAVVVWGKKTPGEAEDGRDQRMAASKRKMIKMMIAVVTVFVFCWLPLNVYIIASQRYETVNSFKYIHYVFFLTHWLAMSHSAYNPIIYCWMNSKFRIGFLHLYHECFSSKKTGGPALQRCNTYSTYVSVRGTSIRGPAGFLHRRPSSISDDCSPTHGISMSAKYNNHRHNHHQYSVDEDFTSDAQV